MTIQTEYTGTRYDKAALVDRNLRMLFGTYKGSMALCRDYGIDISVLDLPIKTAQARLISEIMTASAQYESRASVSEVAFSYDADGKLSVKVVWKLVDDR